MLFWKAQENPFIPAKQSKKSIPIFLTLILAGLLFYGASELIYVLYTQLFKYMEREVAYLRIDPALPIFQDLSSILRPAALVLLVGIGSLYMRFLEGRKIKTAGFQKAHTGRGVIAGILTGTLLCLAFAGFLAFSGALKLNAAAETSFVVRILCVLSIIITGFSFEFFFRGFVLSSLGARSRMITAILLTAILSTAANAVYWGYSPLSVGINFLFSVALGLLVARTGSLWSACLARTSFLLLFQFVFGISYSGIAYKHALFSPAINTASIWIGIEAAMEGSLSFGVIVLAAILLVLLLPKRDPALNQTENKPFFAHVPVKAQSAQEENPEPVHQEPDNAEAEDTTKSTETDTASDAEDWEEEETRSVSNPTYKNPEEYLK